MTYREQTRLDTRLAAIEHHQRALDTCVRQIARKHPELADEINQILSAEKATRPRT